MQDISEKSTIQFRCGTPFVFCQNKTDPAFFCLYFFCFKFIFKYTNKNT